MKHLLLLMFMNAPVGDSNAQVRDAVQFGPFSDRASCEAARAMMIDRQRLVSGTTQQEFERGYVALCVPTRGAADFYLPPQLPGGP